jgi:hypothetical protein
MFEPVVMRHIFGREAFEHVRDNTYRWVDPVDGSFRGYVVAEAIEYAPTIEAQISKGKRQ